MCCSVRTCRRRHPFAPTTHCCSVVGCVVVSVCSVAVCVAVSKNFASGIHSLRQQSTAVCVAVGVCCSECVMPRVCCSMCCRVSTYSQRRRSIGTFSCGIYTRKKHWNTKKARYRLYCVHIVYTYVSFLFMYIHVHTQRSIHKTKKVQLQLHCVHIIYTYEWCKCMNMYTRNDL